MWKRHFQKTVLQEGMRAIVLLCKNYAYREDFARRSDCQSDLLWLRLAALWFSLYRLTKLFWLFGIWWGSLFFTTEITESTEKNL
jgi:hypothetical protein